MQRSTIRLDLQYCWNLFCQSNALIVSFCSGYSSNLILDHDLLSPGSVQDVIVVVSVGQSQNNL